MSIFVRVVSQEMIEVKFDYLICPGDQNFMILRAAAKPGHMPFEVDQDSAAGSKDFINAVPVEKAPIESRDMSFLSRVYLPVNHDIGRHS